MLEKVKIAMLAMARYSWEQGVCAQAMLEAGDSDAVVAMCYDAVNRQSEDGRLANLGQQHGVTDPVAIVPALVHACEVTKDPLLKTALDKAMVWSLKNAPRNDRGIVYHNDNTHQFWVDSLYMFPPTLLAAGYPDEAIKQADGYIDYLWDTDKYLFRHVWDDDKKEFDRPNFWGVGNGWAISGLSRLIEYLPSDKKAARDKYIDVVTKTIAAALPLRHKDGLFHDFLDKPETFLEANFAQQIAYTIVRGAKQGWLDFNLLKQAEDIRKTVHKCVTPCGLVKPVCGSPHFDHPGIAPEGQAFFVLMESAF